MKRSASIESPVPTEEMLHTLRLIVGLDQLLDNFSAKLREMFDMSALYLILHEPITDRYVGMRAKGRREELLDHFNFDRTDALVKWLNVNKSVLDLARQRAVLSFLSERERSLLVQAEAVCVVPLIAANRLIGVLVIGAKNSGHPYTASDMQSLLTLSGQGALALAHAQTHQLQEEKLKKLLHADKLATVGELAAGAAHEIRNPLTSIRSTVQYLKKDLPAVKHAMVDGIIDEVDRIDSIIKGLLSFSRFSELRSAKINVEELLGQTLLLLEPELRKQNIEVEKKMQISGIDITADASMLKQVFLNIMLNSLQAMPNGGSIILTVFVTESRRMLAFTFEDSGCGIPPEDLSRVFDPFYTTKESGTGLGLSIAYGIISKHGGDIQIESRMTGPKPGTKVTVLLPTMLEGPTKTQ